MQPCDAPSTRGTAPGLVDSITGHSLHKLLIDLGLDAGLSAVMVADQVGHANPTETLNTYATRGRPSKRWPRPSRTPCSQAKKSSKGLVDRKMAQAREFENPLAWAACSGDRI